jgi:hypothetical protein
MARVLHVHEELTRAHDVAGRASFQTLLLDISVLESSAMHWVKVLPHIAGTNI